jgi:hypothetical protein
MMHKLNPLWIVSRAAMVCAQTRRTPRIPRPAAARVQSTLHKHARQR